MYKKESILFKILFDKYYFPQRFNTIRLESEKEHNINLLRSTLFNLYPKLPVSTVNRINFILIGSKEGTKILSEEE